MNIAKRIAGWMEMPREKHYAGAGRMFEEDAITALRARLAVTVELLREAYDGRGNPMSVGLAYRVGQILNHLAQEDKS